MSKIHDKKQLDDRISWWSNIAYWTLLILGCGLFLLMNIYTTPKEDDFFHSFIGGGSARPIDSLLDVLRSWVEYYKYDARTANLISFTFNGILGKPVFNVFNTLVFGLMAHLISRWATHRNSVLALVMLFTYMVTAMPVPGETLLWVTGSFNYMWVFTASLFFISYLLKHRNPRPGWLQGIAVVVLSMLAGGINEGTTFGVFGGMVLFYLFNRDKIDRAVVLAMTGYLMGVLLLLTCPGAWERAALEVSHDTGVAQMLAERCLLAMRVSWHYVTPLLAVGIGLVALVKCGFKKTFVTTPFALVFLVLLAFVTVVGKDQQRMYFSMTMYAFILVVMGVNWLCDRSIWLRLAVIAAGLALCVKCYPGNIKMLKSYQEFYDGIEAEITQSPGRQVILKQRYFEGYSRFIKYFNFDSWNSFIRGETLCHQFDKDNIQFVNDTIYSRYHSNRLLDGAFPMPFTALECPDVEAVLAVPDGPFMAVKMRQDTVSYTYQFAQAFKSDGAAMPSEPYFPIVYQGHEYFIFPMIDNNVSKIVFTPFEFDGEPVTLIRTAPNPSGPSINNN